MTEQVLGRVSRMTLREQALEHLRAGILDGTIPSGTRLPEVELSNQLGVSRGTVREALRTLAAAGLVEEIDRGMRVRELTPGEIVELFQVRLALEQEALVRLLAMPDAKQRIDQLAAALPPEEPPDGGIAAQLSAGLAFHGELCRLGGNQMLVALWQQLQNQIRVAVLADSAALSEALLSRSSHEPLLAAMRSGDPGQAGDALREHIEAASAGWSAPPRRSR